jgi:NDP-sugar pyrophosphorylase family protein
MTILATEENKPEKFGVLSIKDDSIKEIKEKPDDPDNTLVNTGIYATSPEIFDKADEIYTKDITDIVANFAKTKEAKFELIKNHWIDIGSAEKLWKADQTKIKHLIDRKDISKDAKVSENTDISDKVIIRPGAEIKPGTVIEGEAYIGENCVIGPNSVIRDSTVNKGTEVRNATLEEVVVFENCFIDPYIHIENSIIGEEVSIKPNSVISESFIGGRSYIEMNNSIRGTKFVPDARTDLSEISK